MSAGVNVAERETKFQEQYHNHSSFRRHAITPASRTGSEIIVSLVKRRSEDCRADTLPRRSSAHLQSRHRRGEIMQSGAAKGRRNWLLFSAAGRHRCDATPRAVNAGCTQLYSRLVIARSKPIGRPTKCGQCPRTNDRTAAPAHEERCTFGRTRGGRKVSLMPNTYSLVVLTGVLDKKF